VISAVSGTGWGWLHTSTAADKSFTFVTPVGAVSRAVSGAARIVDLHISVLGARTVFSLVGLIGAAVIGLRLLVGSTESTIPRNLGLTLLVVALLGPILWGWYLTWGVIVLAPTATGALRRIVIAISTVEVLIAASSVKNLLAGVIGAGIFPGLTLVAAILAIAIVPLGLFGRTGAPSHPQIT
jgi:alpha-1,6-mannosyltransferase